MLARGVETDDRHSLIVGSHSPNSYKEIKALAYMADIPEEIARKFKEQARGQQTQHKMLQAQQESINNLKKMIAFLLKMPRKKMKSPKTSAKARLKRRRMKTLPPNSLMAMRTTLDLTILSLLLLKNHRFQKIIMPRKWTSLRNAWRLSQIETIFKKWGWSDHSSRVRFSSLSSQVQGTESVRLWQQRFVEPTYILLQIPNRERSIKRCHHDSFIHRHP